MTKQLTIRFPKELHIALINLAATQSAEQGRSVSLNEVVNELLEKQLENTKRQGR